MHSLAVRAKKICNKHQLPHELKVIKDFASWNAYPKHIVNSIIKHVLSKSSKTVPDDNHNDAKKVFLNINYAGDNGDQLIKKCFKKLNRYTNQKIIFISSYSVTKLSFFTNTKDRLTDLSKSNVVYQFDCPGCNSSYIGKTERTLFERTYEHASRADSTVKLHIDNCVGCEHIFSINNMFSNDVNTRDFRLNLVRSNTKVINHSSNWNILLFKEALYIKEKVPVLNNGVKASRELQLF